MRAWPDLPRALRNCGGRQGWDPQFGASGTLDQPEGEYRTTISRPDASTAWRFPQSWRSVHINMRMPISVEPASTVAFSE